MNFFFLSTNMEHEQVFSDHSSGSGRSLSTFWSCSILGMNFEGALRFESDAVLELLRCDGGMIL